MTDIQIRAQEAKQVLKRAVAEALEKKRRLGQYAVVVEDGKVMRLLSDGTMVACRTAEGDT